MLTLLIATTLAFTSPQDASPPTEERIELAVDELEAAFRTRDDVKKLEAINAHKDVDAKEVVEVFARALRDSSLEVRKSAVDALRWLKHPESLNELHKQLKRRRKSEEDKELLPSLVKAIGEHHDPKSIKLLASNAFEYKGGEALRARILALGNIRSKESVTAVMKLMHAAKRETIQNHMKQFRLSLMVLTATDHGESQDRWTEWWNKNKQKFEIAKKAPKLPPKEEALWNRYWGYEYEIVRGKRRRKRGSDPEKSR